MYFFYKVNLKFHRYSQELDMTYCALGSDVPNYTLMRVFVLQNITIPIITDVNNRQT